MNLERAYDVMGLPEDATLKVLEEKYYELTAERLIDPDKLDRIQRAYNLIKAHIKELNPPPEKSFWQKIGDYIYSNKIPLFFGLFALIVIASITYTLVGGIAEQREIAKHPDDLKFTFFGNFNEGDDTEPLEARFHTLFPEWDKINVHIQFAPGDEGTQLDFEADQEAQAYLVGVKPDIFVLDTFYYDQYDDGTVFAQLDEFDTDDPHVLLDNEGNVVGLDLTDHPYFKNMQAAKSKKFAIIPIEAKQYDNAIALFRELHDSF